MIDPYDRCRTHLTNLLWELKDPKNSHMVDREITAMETCRDSLPPRDDKAVRRLNKLWNNRLEPYRFDGYSSPDRFSQQLISSSDQDILDDVMTSISATSYNLILSTFPLPVRLWHRMVVDPIIHVQKLRTKRLQDCH